MSACISKHMHSEVWDEITYPFPNWNGAAAEVWEFISNSISHFIMGAITYPVIMLGLIKVKPC